MPLVYRILKFDISIIPYSLKKLKHNVSFFFILLIAVLKDIFKFYNISDSGQITYKLDENSNQLHDFFFKGMFIRYKPAALGLLRLWPLCNRPYVIRYWHRWSVAMFSFYNKPQNDKLINRIRTCTNHTICTLYRIKEDAWHFIIMQLGLT